MKLFAGFGTLFILAVFAMPSKAATEKACGPDAALPQREGVPIQTSGSVPHVQIGVQPIAALNKELHKHAFSLPGIEERPTVVSLPGAIGMWLDEDVTVAQPQTIVSGREFAHVHPDGSLHAPLPFKRAVELEQKGWGERHPWADTRDGWEGFVMLFSATTPQQLTTLVRLVTESYNYVTGQNLKTRC